MSGDLQDISSILKQLRTELKLSQESLAHEIGVSFASVNRWEKGKSSPSKLARKQIQSYCDRLFQEGKIQRAVIWS